MNPSEIDITPVDISRFWSFDEEWCDKNIDDKYDLDKICKHSAASWDIQYFIHGYGEEIHSKIKYLHSKIKMIKEGIIDDMKASDLDIFIHDLDSGCYETGWDRIPYSLITGLEVVNYDLAPAPAQSAINEVIKLIEIGKAKYKQCKSQLEECVDFKRSIEANEQFERNTLKVAAMNESKTHKIQDSERIERAHVQIKEGFVYVLSHSLMKQGIYKIGFTSRNPDIRAVELSREIGIPRNYKVVRYWRTNDPYIIEQRIHSVLSEYSLGGEFFECDIELITVEIEKQLLTSKSGPM